jgi:hypothetical protein
MRITEANSTGQRPRRSWRICHPLEQARTMGKRRAVSGYDRSPLDPIFGSVHELQPQFTCPLVRPQGLYISFRFARQSCFHAVTDQLENSPREPAGSLKARRGLEAKALGISLERSKLQEARHEVIVRFMAWRCFALVNSHSRRRQLMSCALFGCQLFHFGQDLIRGQHPIHRNGVAPFRWTIES